MICRKKNYIIGDSVVVKHCWGGYQLPSDLPEGVTVKVVGREIGCALVQFQGKQFTVFIACVESGWEYRINGKWRDESDPLIAGRFQKEKTRRHYQLAVS
jgi:hypothetical protein